MELSYFIDSIDLNKYEKEIIIYLSSVNNANANKIYKNTKIPKGRIYSVINSLIEKRFINLIPTNPKKYKIENIKESLKNYLNKKQTLIGKEIKKIKEIQLIPKSTNLDKKSPSVYSFTGRKEHLEALISLRNRAKKRLLNVAPLFVGSFASNMAIYKSINRGIKVKIITRKITKKNKKNIKECLKIGAQVRVLNSFDLLNYLIKDNNEFLLGLQDYKNNEERLNLISRNKGLLIILEKYFNELWKKSKKINSSKL